MSVQAAKHEVLKLCQYLAPDEPLPAWNAMQSLRDTVARLCASPGITSVQMALVAVYLAELLDEAEPV